MELIKSDIEKILQHTGALLNGHFKLSSGLHSNRYIQCASVLKFPDIASELGKRLSMLFKDVSVDCIVSPAMGGIIIGHETASSLGVPFLFSERQDKVMTFRRGFLIKPGTKVVIIEDVITTGKSTGEVVALIESSGAIVTGIGAISNRSSAPLNLPKPVQSLIRLEVQSWKAEDCPLCKANQPITSPGSRFS